MTNIELLEKYSCAALITGFNPKVKKIADNWLEPVTISEIQGLEYSCGLYFLILDEIVSYVGITKGNLYKRITMPLNSHLESKWFDSVRFIPISPSEQEALETRYIQLFAPVFNSAKMPRGWECKEMFDNTYLEKKRKIEARLHDLNCKAMDKVYDNIW